MVAGVAVPSTALCSPVSSSLPLCFFFPSLRLFFLLEFQHFVDSHAPFKHDARPSPVLTFLLSFSFRLSSFPPSPSFFVLELVYARTAQPTRHLVSSPHCFPPLFWFGNFELSPDRSFFDLFLPLFPLFLSPLDSSSFLSKALPLNVVHLFPLPNPVGHAEEIDSRFFCPSLRILPPFRRF